MVYSFFLIAFFCCNLALASSRFFQITLGLQILFYAFAGVGWALEKRGKSRKIFYLPYYFVLVNIASLLGIFNLLTGSLSPTWQTIRQAKPVGNEPGISVAGKES